MYLYYNHMTHPNMDKDLTVYPISSGDKLNVYANNIFDTIRILDMQGNVVFTRQNYSTHKGQVDIRELENATYIIEVKYPDEKTARSVFVKS